MLAELYEYANKLKKLKEEKEKGKKDLSTEPGWAEKNVKAYINLSKEGIFLNVLLYQTKEK